MAKFGMYRKLNNVIENSLLADDVRRELLERDVIDSLVRRLSHTPERVRSLLWALAISLAKYGRLFFVTIMNIRPSSSSI